MLVFQKDTIHYLNKCLPTSMMHLYITRPQSVLTYWGQDKMAVIFQTTFSNACSWMKMNEFQLRQPRLRPIEALSGFGGEYRSRKEDRNFDCSDSWRILPDLRVLAHRPHDLPRSSEATHQTQSHSLQRIHPNLNSIFASKLHARDPLHCHLQAVVIVMEILSPDPEKLPSSLWSRNLRVLPKLMFGHVIEYAGDLNFYHNILCFFAWVSNSILKKRELNSNMHNGFKLSKKILISLMWSWLDYGLDGINMEY